MLVSEATQLGKPVSFVQLTEALSKHDFSVDAIKKSCLPRFDCADKSRGWSVCHSKAKLTIGIHKTLPYKIFQALR